MALRDLISTIEHALAWHCVDTVGIEDSVRERLVERPGLLHGHMLVDGHPGASPNAKNRRTVWGRWFGQERAFFDACADVVDRMSWSDIVTVVGAPLEHGIARYRAAEAAHTAPLPGDPVARHVERHGDAWIRGYSTYDLLQVPPGVLDLLDKIDGRPLDVVRSRDDPQGLLTDDQVRWLLDFHLIAPRTAE